MLEPADLHEPGGDVVGEASRPYDRPVEVTGAEVVVGVLLGPQVDLEHLVGVGVGALGAHRGDHHVAAYAGGLGGIGQHDRRALVDGLLALGVAVGSAPGREHDGVGVPDDAGQLVDVGRLEVDEGRLDAVLLEVGDVLRLADDAHRLVPCLGDEPSELPGDLSVSTCDDDAHVPTVDGER